MLWYNLNYKHNAICSGCVDNFRHFALVFIGLICYLSMKTTYSLCCWILVLFGSLPEPEQCLAYIIIDVYGRLMPSVRICHRRTSCQDTEAVMTHQREQSGVEYFLTFHLVLDSVLHGVKEVLHKPCLVCTVEHSDFQVCTPSCTFGLVKDVESFLENTFFYIHFERFSPKDGFCVNKIKLQK